MNKIECKCGYKSYAFDIFMDLSIAFPKKRGIIDLKDCFENFIQPEKMESCGYKCPKCLKLDLFTKELTLFRFP